MLDRYQQEPDGLEDGEEVIVFSTKSRPSSFLEEDEKVQKMIVLPMKPSAVSLL